MFRKLALSAGWLGLIQLVSYAIPLLTLPIIARAFGPETFGMPAIATAQARRQSLRSKAYVTELLPYIIEPIFLITNPGTLTGMFVNSVFNRIKKAIVLVLGCLIRSS
jgi:hypothetical protein